MARKRKEAAAPVICGGCGKTRQGRARGWTVLASGAWCGECWAARFLGRALTLPVAAPAEGDWPQLNEALRRAWVVSTDLANWAAGELFLADVLARRGAGVGLPPMPRVDLYKLMNTQPYPGRADWAGAAGSASQLLDTVGRHYQRHRKAAVWTHGEQPAAYRYPYPWPVRAQEWRASADDEGRPLVSLTLPGGRALVRLRGGSPDHPEAGYARQARLFARIAAGELERGVASVYRQRCSESCHRPTSEDREPGGGQRAHYRTMVKLVYWLPRPEVRAKSGLTMNLHTDPKVFWVAETGERAEQNPWILNADHVRRWIGEHRGYLRRMREDLKFEKRWPKRVRRAMNEALEKRCLRQHHRLADWCHQAVALVANYARRRGVDVVHYDDACESYLPSFPWTQLRNCLRSRLAEYGVECLARAEDASGGMVDESPGLAREE